VDTDIEVIIKINKNNEMWLETRGVTNTAPRQVDPAKVVSAFALLYREEAKLHSFDLPEMCVHQAISIEREHIASTIFVLYRPAQVRQIKYYNQDYTVPFPPMLFKYVLQEKRIVESFVVAVKESLENLNNETPVYDFPLNNVYHDGRICYGNNLLPEIESPKQLSTMPEYFLILPFSEGTPELYEALKGQDKYPLETLRQNTFYSNYSSFKSLLDG